MEYPIRVAQMMTDMNYGGVEMVVMNYYRNIDRTKVQFDFFALEGSSIPQREEIERLGGRVYVVPKYTHLPQYEREIQRIFRENDYLIVHSHMNALGVFSLYGAKKAGVPNRIAHNHSTAGKGETKKNIFKYALRPFSTVYPTQLCACSRFAGEWLFGKNHEFRVIKNAIDLNRFHYDAEIRKEIRANLHLEDAFVVGNIGRVCYQKNHEFLIEIFNQLVKQKKNAVLLLIGEGELEQDIRKKVAEQNLQDRVIFLGKQNDTSIYYQAMDAFVLPSRYEGLGMVAVEAQACAVPTICSTEVPKEARILSDTIFLSLDSEPEIWAKSILSAAQHYKRKDTSEEMKQAGFDISVEASKLADFYCSLLQAEETNFAKNRG